MKHILTLAALMLATACFGQSYDLTIEQWPPASAQGSVYRIYIEANDPTDKLSGIFGNDQQPLVFSTPEGIFNSNGLNEGPCAPGPNNPLFGFFPELADDSYICPWGEEWSIVEDPLPYHSYAGSVLHNFWMDGVQWRGFIVSAEYGIECSAYRWPMVRGSGDHHRELFRHNQCSNLSLW